MAQIIKLWWPSHSILKPTLEESCRKPPSSRCTHARAYSIKHRSTGREQSTCTAARNSGANSWQHQAKKQRPAGMHNLLPIPMRPVRANLLQRERWGGEGEEEGWRHSVTKKSQIKTLIPCAVIGGGVAAFGSKGLWLCRTRCCRCILHLQSFH